MDSWPVLLLILSFFGLSLGAEDYAHLKVPGADVRVVVESEVVTLPNGMKLQGSKFATGVSAWRGIPYAQAPVGALRWQPPQEITDISEEVYNATAFGSSCLQKDWGAEDCLFLNVYANLDVSLNKEMNEEGLPVAVFVHGGTYETGSSTQYQGEYDVDYWNGQGILVTLNYRLNVFGFLGSDALRTQDQESGSTGNYGIQDQRLAFKFVQDNIKAWGGDPNRVMIFGESAGAGSMSVHIGAKKSWGYFSSVAMESGSNSQWVMQPLSVSELMYQKVLDATGCEDVQCLLDLDAQTLLDKTVDISGSTSGFVRWSPVVDNVEATTHPFLSVQRGEVADVPILLGTNLDDGSVGMVPTTLNQKQLDRRWEHNKLDVQTMDSLYLDGKSYPTDETGYTEYFYAAMRSYGDMAFGCTAKYTADTLSKHMEKGTLKKAKSYMYYFQHMSQFNNATLVRHASELPYAFHLNYLVEGYPQDVQTADLTATYWGNFLVKQDPQQPSGFGLNLEEAGIAPWDTYSHDDVKVQSIEQGTKDGVSVLTSFKQDECDYLLPLIEQDIRQYFE